MYCSSPKRTEALKKKIIELKPEATATKLNMYCETRWVERHEAILLLKDFLKNIESKPEATKLNMYCETRWVERHEAILLLKDFLKITIAAIEKSIRIQMVVIASPIQMVSLMPYATSVI